MRSRELTPTMEELLAHSEWVWRLARRLVGDDERARDVVQETWLRAMRAPPTIAPESSPRPWLGVVVRSIAAQFQRTDLRRSARELEASRPDTQPSVDRVRAREEARRAVVEAVLALPEPYREAVVLRYFDELSPGAIAKRLVVPGSTVRSRLQRAHELLRVRLASERGDGARDWLAALVPLIPRRASLVPVSIGALLVNIKFVALAGAAVGAAWLIWFAAGSSSRREPGASALVESTAARVGAMLRSEADHREAAETAPIDSADTATRAETASTVRVRVVERANGKPLAGAIVSYAGRDQLGATSDDLERDLAVRGEKLVADDNGEVEFPYSDPWMHIAARSGELWGQTQASALRPEVTILELVRDREIAVQVVDRSGQPVAGVPLVLSSVGANEHSSGWSGSTDPLGIAWIRHFDAAAPRAFASSAELVVEFGFPQAASHGARVDLARLPAEPLRLELPPCGKLRLRLVDARGEIVSAPYQIQASTMDGKTHLYPPLMIDGGEGVLPFIGLDLDLMVNAFPRRPGSFNGHAELVSAPSRDGQELLVEFEVPRNAMLPHGRAVDANSMPLVRRELDCVFSSSDSPELTTSARTNDTGDFYLERYPKRGDSVPIELRVVAKSDSSGPALEASRVVEATEFRRNGELGVLQLTSAPLITSGIVVNDLGQPVARATVELLRHVEVDRELAAAGYATNTNGWSPVPLRSATTDEGGAFAISGVELPATFALRARALGYCASANTPIEPAAAEVTLRVTRASALAGSVRLPHPAFASVLRVQTRPVGDADPSHVRSSGVSFDGCFRIDDVWPGAQRVAVTMNPRGSELLAVEWIVAEPGQVTRDPRLRDIDLGDTVCVFELEIVSRTNEPVDFGVVTYRSSVDGRSDQAPIRGGHATIASTSRELDLTVRAPGFQVLETHVSSPRATLTLDAGYPITLSLRPELEFADGFAVEGELEIASKHDESRPRVFAGHTTRITLSRAGTGTIDWYVVDRATNRRQLVERTSLEVHDASHIAEFVLAITQAQLDVVISELRAKRKR